MLMILLIQKIDKKDYYIKIYRMEQLFFLMFNIKKSIVLLIISMVVEKYELP